MSYSPPDPPREIPADIASKLDEQSPEVLRKIARFAEELAEHREREVRLAESEEKEEVEERPENLPNGVPSKATITIKEILEKNGYIEPRDTLDHGQIRARVIERFVDEGVSRGEVKDRAENLFSRIGEN